jgi:hypothetical protein
LPIEIPDYAALVAAIRQRMIDLEITFSELDHISGLQSGYSSKLICGPKTAKHFGPVSLGCVLSALALKLTVSVDHEQAARLQHRWVKRQIPLPLKPPQMARGESNAVATTRAA